MHAQKQNSSTKKIKFLSVQLMSQIHLKVVEKLQKSGN